MRAAKHKDTSKTFCHSFGSTSWLPFFFRQLLVWQVLFSQVCLFFCLFFVLFLFFVTMLAQKNTKTKKQAENKKTKI